MAFFSTDNPKVDTVGTPSLKVVIDAVTADATAKYVEPDQELEIYTDYTINHRYEKSRHTDNRMAVFSVAALFARGYFVYRACRRC